MTLCASMSCAARSQRFKRRRLKSQPLGASLWARYGALLWGCCTACLARPASSRDPSPATARSDSLPAGATTVPIQLVHGNLIGVPAEVDGHRGLFILDTGSPLLLVNSAHLQGGPAGTLDTVVTTDRASIRGGWFAEAVTVRIGTLTIPVNQATTRTNESLVAANADFSRHEHRFGQAFLGLIGPPVLAQYETVIDYPHRQLTLIPVDTLGHRLVSVPQYTPQTVIPIFPRGAHSVTAGGTHWYLEAMLGSRRDTLVIDTGDNHNMLSATTATQLAGHLTLTGQTDWSDGETIPSVRLDRLTVAGQPYLGVPFYISHSRHCLGGPFFRDRGVVGFNFRAHQLLLYKRTS